MLELINKCFCFIFNCRFLQNILKKILHGMEKERKDMIEKQKAVEWKEDTENKNKITRFKNECIKVNVS